MKLLATAFGLILATGAAWHNGLDGEFLYDDVPAITANPSITSWSPPWRAFWAGRDDLTVSGRPLANFTLALNHALHGTHPSGYHVFNVVIHALAGLALFGLVRRTLILVDAAKSDAPRKETSRSAVGPSLAKAGERGPPFAVVASDDPTKAIFPAAAIALLWLLHPLQTESVTYIIQRVETLMGLFFLLTLYCFARSVEAVGSAPRRGWQCATIAACLAGMACKEVMVVAPLVVLLYDRTFRAGTFRDAVRVRAGLHACLWATIIPLLIFVVLTGDRGGSAGFGGPVPPWEYALVQGDAIWRYLALSVWPHPLVFDYGILEPKDIVWLWPKVAGVGILLAATIWALRRRPVVGFLAASFFLILAPSSSVVPVVTETIAEHRMYLPLAAVTTLAVLGLVRLAGARALVAVPLLAVGLGWGTAQRNRDYRSAFAIWTDTVAKRPDNARAHNNLGSLQLAHGELAAAAASFQRAVTRQPYYASAHYNLGIVLNQLGRPLEALPHFAGAVEIEPDFVDAHVNWGNTLLGLHRLDEAVARYRTALALQPESADTHFNLALAHERLGDAARAAGSYREALRLQPEFTDAQLRLANLLAQTGELDAAIREYQEILRRMPAHPRARNNLANAFLLAGRIDDAIREYEAILAANPADDAVRRNLAEARALRATKPAR